MRKRFKKKRRSCAFCKPHKMCGECRWNARELAGLEAFERERRELLS